MGAFPVHTLTRAHLLFLVLTVGHEHRFIFDKRSSLGLKKKRFYIIILINISRYYR